MAAYLTTFKENIQKPLMHCICSRLMIIWSYGTKISSWNEGFLPETHWYDFSIAKSVEIEKSFETHLICSLNQPAAIYSNAGAGWLTTQIMVQGCVASTSFILFVTRCRLYVSSLILSFVFCSPHWSWSVRIRNFLIWLITLLIILMRTTPKLLNSR